jgi:hypothetical protein
MGCGVYEGAEIEVVLGWMDGWRGREGEERG